MSADTLQLNAPPTSWPMDRPFVRLAKSLSLLLAGAGLMVHAQQSPSPHLSIIQPGGLPGWPVVTGVQPMTNKVIVTWDGPNGYYQLWEKRLTDTTWQAVGKATNASRMAVVTPLSSSAVFKVSGPSPLYAGWQNCAECHGPTLTLASKTAHGGAFTNATFIALGGQTDSSCLPCHTVGYGLPTGFKSRTLTPQLGAVECENCHGSAANHAANPDDSLMLPRVEMAGTMCGGCHNARFVPARVAGLHKPQYEEWSSSAHATVVPDVQAGFTGTSGSSEISACGRCHSGSVREALTEGQKLPTGQEAAAIGIVCATCHDAHQRYQHTNPLRGVVVSPSGIAVTNNQLGAFYTNQIPYPLASTNDFYITTSSTNIDNPNINICAQCHNHRGATWQSNSRPPHKSPQYNMLLGTVGEFPTGTASYAPATHAFFEKQCVRCHMQTNYVSAQVSGSAGHMFEVTAFDTCKDCHPAPDVIVSVIKTGITNQIQDIKVALDLWASTKAPVALWTKYGTRAWEYTTPGDLSPGGPGPNSTEQALIPVNIQKARYDLYLVLYDGSYGVHNGPFAAELLNAAQDWVDAALNP